MAARKLATANSGNAKKRPRGKPFVKGQSGNPRGLTSEQRIAADTARNLALSHGQEIMPDGRTRARAALDKLHELGLDGNQPALTCYLDRVGYKPTDHVSLTSDGLVLSIRKKVVDADSDPC